MVTSVSKILQLGQFFEGPVKVEDCGSEEDLPEELRAIVGARDEKGFIDGPCLLDYCGQWSKGKGCSVTPKDFQVANEPLLVSDDRPMLTRSTDARPMHIECEDQKRDMSENAHVTDRIDESRQDNRVLDRDKKSSRYVSEPSQGYPIFAINTYALAK